MDAETRHLLSLFAYEHLPERLQLVSKSFHELAHAMVRPLDDGGMGLRGVELAVGLRKLVEAKDCAVRAALPRGG